MIRVLTKDIRALRPSHFSLCSAFTGLDRGATLAAIDRLGRRVLPAPAERGPRTALADMGTIMVDRRDNIGGDGLDPEMVRTALIEAWT